MFNSLKKNIDVSSGPGHCGDGQKSSIALSIAIKSLFILLFSLSKPFGLSWPLWSVVNKGTSPGKNQREKCVGGRYRVPEKYRRLPSVPGY